MTTTRRNSQAIKSKLLVLLAFSLPATAQIPPQDPCAGLQSFAREDCVLQGQARAREDELRKHLQQQQLLDLQQQHFLEQIRGQQLQNEALRRQLEADDAAMKRAAPR